MTREEARKLIGGYATGSLTDVEKRALYEAALEDQDLFEELAREQEFKEILEEPGAKERLRAVVSAPKRARPTAPAWLWAAVAVTLVAIGITSWQFLRTPKQETQIAQAVPQPQVELPAPPAAAPAPAPPAAARPHPRRQSPRSAPAPVGGAAAPPAPEAKKSEPQPQSAASVADQVKPAAPLPAGTAGGRAQAIRMAPAQPAGFSFNYSLEADTLVLRFAAEGWLGLHFSPGAGAIEHAHVAAGETRREQIPNNATEATIIYTSGEQTDAPLGVRITRNDKAGVVADPSGNRIELLLKFY